MGLSKRIVGLVIVATYLLKLVIQRVSIMLKGFVGAISAWFYGLRDQFVLFTLFMALIGATATWACIRDRLG